tara:strand:+ start:1513 stop:2118 length:606 start_codon:yes stop_codon:yes gene_type:complete
MIEDQILKIGIQDKQVLEIINSIDRQKFVSEDYAQAANAEGLLPIGHGQTISQPFIVAFMTDNLKMDTSHKVLEIGTGSGYQSAVLASLSHHVHTIEVIDELAKKAALRLEKFGYNNVTVHIADGYNGLPDEAPFDRIIVTAASEEVPETLIGQLSEGGIMILPIGKQFEIQYLWLIKKEMDGTIIREKILPVRFLPIVRK